MEIFGSLYIKCLRLMGESDESSLVGMMLYSFLWAVCVTISMFFSCIIFIEFYVYDWMKCLWLWLVIVIWWLLEMSLYLVILLFGKCIVCEKFNLDILIYLFFLCESGCVWSVMSVLLNFLFIVESCESVFLWLSSVFYN